MNVRGKEQNSMSQLFYAAIYVTLKKHAKPYDKSYMIYYKSIKYMDEKIHINFRILVTSGDRVMGTEWEKSSTLTVVFH